MNKFNTSLEAKDYSVINPSETVEFKDYHNNGQLDEHRFYVNGKRHGEYKSYHNNGQLSVHCFFVNGLYTGEYKTYYSDGQLMYHCFYVAGEWYDFDHLKDGSYKSLCILSTLFDGNLINENI